MKTRLLVVAICILGLPIWGSNTQGDKLVNSAPFATVALAGHITGGGRYCDCGTSDCECDPGEMPAGPNAITSDSQQGQSTLVDTESTYTNEVGLGLLTITILLLWLKVRA